MKIMIVNHDSSLQTLDVAVPTLDNPQHIRVKIAYSGLCGSDIPRIFNQAAHYYPITIGHEFSGRIVEIGSEVTGLAIGDKVACVPLLPCFNCSECQRHYYSLCKNYTFIGSRQTGGFAEYSVIDYRNVFKLPDKVPLLAGAFFEPLTVGMHALLLAGGCQGKNVIIIGAGTIGLLAMQCANAMQAQSITLIDINPERLQIAQKLGATYGYNSAQLSPEEITQKLTEFRFDQLILETAGAPATVNLAIEIAGPRAQIALIGTLHHDLLMPEQRFAQILRKELHLFGSWMNYSAPWPGQEWSLVSQFIEQHQINFTDLIAGQGNFDEFMQMVSALNGQPMNGKLLLTPVSA